MTNDEITDDEIRSSIRRVSAGPIFDDIWSDPYYDFVQECFGAYKIEFTWGLANWAHVSDSPTAFGYTNWRHFDEIEYDLPEGEYGVYGRTMYTEGEYPVNIEFDIPDFRRAVREYATSYDDCTDGSEIMARQEALEKLRVWQITVNTLLAQVEVELRIIRANK
jgi:hypothetical protein